MLNGRDFEEVQPQLAGFEQPGAAANHVVFSVTTSFRTPM